MHSAAKHNEADGQVIWPRVDQKTCLKSILAMGLEPVIVANRTEGDEVATVPADIDAAIASHGAENILAVVITTSCFAPRAPDDAVGVAELCKRADVPLLVNNAYGVQSEPVMKALARAATRGRVDGVIQSTDKNFMVPVGGAILATCAGRDELGARVAGLYPGRAGSSVAMDLFMTLLALGEAGFSGILAERAASFDYLRSQVAAVANRHGERLLHTPRNKSPPSPFPNRAHAYPTEQYGLIHVPRIVFPRISMAVTLKTFERPEAGDAGRQALSELGAMLFARSVSGTRVVTCVKQETVGGITFHGYGAHVDDYPTTCAPASAT